MATGVVIYIKCNCDVGARKKPVVLVAQLKKPVVLVAQLRS